MTVEDHERFVQLHRALDQLCAAMIFETGRIPSQITMLELMRWSFEKTQEGVNEKRNPTQPLEDFERILMFYGLLDPEARPKDKDREMRAVARMLGWDFERTQSAYDVAVIKGLVG